MTRTITGNSIHYVLDAHGRPLDALPGLYSASAFVKGLNNTLDLAAMKPTDEQLRQWHANAAQRLANAPAAIAREPLSLEAHALIRAKAAPPAREAGIRAMSKIRVEDPLVRMLGRLEESMARDTLRNEYDFHRQIHQWFAAGAVADFRSFNDRVYAELFLTPASDPWLGLAPPDAYPGLDHHGLALR